MPNYDGKPLSEMTRQEVVATAIAFIVIGSVICSACVISALRGVYWNWIGFVFDSIGFVFVSFVVGSTVVVVFANCGGGGGVNNSRRCDPPDIAVGCFLWFERS